MSQQPPVPRGRGDRRNDGRGDGRPRHGSWPGENPTEFLPRVSDLRRSPEPGPGRPGPGRGADAAETTYIPPVRDEYDDDYWDYPDEIDDQDEPRSTRPPAVGGRGGKVFRTVGELCLTAGMVVLLFVVYEVYVTNIFSAQKQSTATQALNKEWDTVGSGRNAHYNVTDGQGIAKMFIPALGVDYQFTIIEGTTQADLAIGPGHYTGTALPGQPGDFAVAGHRVGEGAPFNDLDLVQPCDAIVVETQADWYVYRMLPLASQRNGWNPAANPLCNGPDGDAKVVPLTGEYSQTNGQEIVLPTEGDVIAPVPHYPYTNLSSGQEASLMTMTTCHPKFSDKQRMILHAVLVKDWQKDPAHPNNAPPELKETS